MGHSGSVSSSGLESWVPSVVLGNGVEGKGGIWGVERKREGEMLPNEGRDPSRLLHLFNRNENRLCKQSRVQTLSARLNELTQQIHLCNPAEDTVEHVTGPWKSFEGPPSTSSSPHGTLQTHLR